MKIVPCLIEISKQKHIPVLYSLWIASHLRVLPYFSMKLYHSPLLWSLLMLLSLLFLLFLLLLYYKRFQNSSLHVNFSPKK